jgi:hypothetical protein
MVTNTVTPGSIVRTAAFEFEFDPEDDVEESDLSEEAVESPVDESPTSTDEVDDPDTEPSIEEVVVEEVSASDEEESTPAVDELEVEFDVAPFEEPVAVPAADPVVAPFMVVPVEVAPFVADPVAAATFVAEPVVVPLLAVEPVVVNVVDPVAVVAPVVVDEPDVVEVDVDPVELVDPGQTIVSPLHIWPEEQSLSVYWQLIEHSCAETEVSVVHEQLWPHSDMLLPSPTRLQRSLQSSDVETPLFAVQTRRAQLPCVDWRKRPVAAPRLWSYGALAGCERAACLGLHPIDILSAWQPAHMSASA